MCNIIISGKLSEEALTSCILAIGWICDSRPEASDIDDTITDYALKTVRDIKYVYSPSTVMKDEKMIDIVTKMINGDSLDGYEEKFLLTKLNI